MGSERVDSLADLLGLMVRHETVSRPISGRDEAEGDLVSALEDIARGWGLRPRRLPVPGEADNLLIAEEIEPGAGWLMFDSHLDTVSLEGMTVEPLGAEVRDGCLYGRGSCDTKASGAAMLWALKEHVRGGTLGGNVALLLSVNEEAGMTGIQSFLGRDLPELGWALDGVIVGEPTELRPVTAHNGVLRWKLTAEGRSAHSASPWEGVSAISMMCRMVEVVESEYAGALEASHPLTGRAVCTVNMIEGGTAVNMVPGRCEAWVDRRLAPGERAEGVLPAVAGLVEPVARAYGGRVEQERLLYHPALVDEGNEALTERVQGVLRGLGREAGVRGAGFCTHGSFFCEAGIPSVVLGPGDSGRAHQACEWVELDELEAAARVYGGLMGGRGEG